MLHAKRTVSPTEIHRGEHQRVYWMVDYSCIINLVFVITEMSKTK
jgi:hypothetical protein